MEMLNRYAIYIVLFFTVSSFAQDSTFTDCVGNIAPESWLGDGFCDDSTYSWNNYLIDFNCAEFNYDGGDCPIPIDPNITPGCMDPEAINYNPLADTDNGGCANVECGEGEAKMLLEITLDQYPGETGWILTDISTGQPVESVMAGEYTYSQANTTIPYQVCVPESGVELILSDTYGDGLGGSQWGGADGSFTIMGDLEPCGSPDILWELPDSNFGAVAYSGVIYLEHCDIPTVYGCMDAGYMEFNPFAQVDDGSCETEHIVGCLDWNAYNYDSGATLNDVISVCEYRLVINDSGGDGWGDSHLVITQGDSIHGVYTLGPGIYEEVKWLYLRTDIPVHIRYFELGPPQVPQEELEFQTMHNSFFLFNEHLDLLISGGANPFAFNGAGALQPFEPPFWHIYNAMPYCGDYCIDIVYGCMDEQSLNYNSDANTDDESCIEVVEGCTSPFAFNYDSLANVDDESCVPVVVGCMNEEAWNYNPDANTADESCLYFGCTDNLALNYDSTANVNNDNCIYPIPGCTEPEAFNFELEANVNDGSCIPVIIGCMDPLMFNYNEIANTSSDNCIPFIFGCTDSTAFNYDPVANANNESCVAINYGCTDPGAFNYNIEANTEDFSCIDIIYGCTDEASFNYDSLANTNNGGCIAVDEGCMDNTAHNYNALANTEDGSCLYDAGCIDGPGVPYWLNDTCYAWVIMIDPYCCSNSWDEKCQQIYWSCSWDSPLDTRNLLRGHNIVMYPNPMDDTLNILTNGSVGIKVYDITGKLIIKIKESQTHKGLNQLDVRLLPSGIYNFIVTYKGNTSTTKVLKK